MTATAAFAMALLAAAAPDAQKPIDVKPSVEKGLKWLAAQQQEDGRWVGRADSQPTMTTATAGLALLMEGSTLKSGTYAPNLRKAVEWVEKNAQPSGALVSSHPSEATRPVAAHAQALLFLACAYDVDDDPERRKRLAALMRKAVEYAGATQTVRGGWGFNPARAGVGADDVANTAAILHALFVARKVGLEVPRKVTEKAADYLAKSTLLGGAAARPGFDPNFAGAAGPMVAYTAGAAVALLASDGPRPAALNRWLDYLRAARAQPWPRQATATSLAYQFQAARLAASLGEGGHRHIDPSTRDANALTWSRFRAAVFPSIIDAQAADGSWPDTIPGPVYGSSIALIILQLENEYAAAFAR